MAISNLERFKRDLERLDRKGAQVLMALQRKHDPKVIDKQITDYYGQDEGSKVIKDLGEFSAEYQVWYSEALPVVKQLLPDRLDDFKSHYNRPRTRKDITPENYVLDDAVQGLTARKYGEVVAQPITATPRLEAQLAILKACQGRFESSLFDLRQIVQADLFDSELEAGRELLKNGFVRAAGAMAGVVLEHHLQGVISSHAVPLPKKNPTLGDLSQSLKEADVIDMAEWRRLQHLGDLRNKCDHKKAADPTKDEVLDLIAGVERTIKTLF